MERIIDISEVLLEAGLSASATETERAIVQACILKAEGAIRRFLQYDPVQAVRTEFYPQSDLRSSDESSIWGVSESQAYLRRQSDTASDELQVRHLPVRERDVNGQNAIDLRVDYDGKSGARSGSFSSEAQKTEGVDFWPNYDGQDAMGYKVCWDGIIRARGLWPSEPGCVRITYLAGFTQSELRGQSAYVDASPIVEATIDESVRRLQKVFSRMKKTGPGFGVGPLSSENLGDYSYTADSSTLSRLVGGGFDVLPETELKLRPFTNDAMSIFM